MKRGAKPLYGECMTIIKMSIEGDLVAKINKASEDTRAKVDSVLRQVALSVQADAVRSMHQGDKSGIVYKKYNPNRIHRASAAGEAPASDTGVLAGSIEMTQVAPLHYQVGTALVYGRWLEYGTLKIAERPWLRPAVEKNRALLRDAIRSALFN